MPEAAAFSGTQMEQKADAKADLLGESPLPE